jgi:AraC-like DNA-binding protein
MEHIHHEWQDTANFSSNEYLVVNSCGFQNSLPLYTVLRPSGRKDFLVLFVADGNLDALYGGEKHSLQAGDLLIYEPGEPQTYTTTTPARTLWCHFTGTAAKDVMTELKLCGGTHRLSGSHAVENAYSTLTMRFHGHGQKSMINAALLELLSALSSAAHSGPMIRTPKPVKAAIEYLHAHYNEKITLAELADLSGYSKSRFSHLFAEATGTTPIQYQNELRLQSAKEMLTATFAAVSQIAYQCGFDDPLYFSRLFKKKFGASPSDIRAGK